MVYFAFTKIDICIFNDEERAFVLRESAAHERGIGVVSEVHESVFFAAIKVAVGEFEVETSCGCHDAVTTVAYDCFCAIEIGCVSCCYAFYSTSVEIASVYLYVLAIIEFEHSSLAISFVGVPDG